MHKLLLLLVATLAMKIAFAQMTITGNVVDSDSIPLAGVNVIEKGLNNGATTDANGNFSLTCRSQKAELVFSFIGFATQQVVVSSSKFLKIVLLPDLTTLQTVEIVGSRNVNRTSLETPVPVDLIDIRSLANASGQLDLNQLLQVVAPSFNINSQSGSDGADHIDPASIRGLGPDQTLVLVNGKRRHQTSSVNIYGSRGRGNTGTDLNAIPVAAIERIEILRDGASAQYGSDAIAGVVNIVLKTSVNELTANFSTGMRNARAPEKFDVLYDKRFDGQTFQAALNYGFQTAKRGFVNMTTEFLGKDFTNRPTDPKAYDVYRRQFGDAALDNYRLFFNSVMPLNDNAEFYSFGGFNFRNGRAYAFTRFAGDANNVDEIYPDGFDPIIGSRIVDKSASVGVRATVRGWHVDVNNTFGENRFHFLVDNTVNASMLEKSPSHFNAGGFGLSQNTTGISVSRYFQKALSGVNLAFGTEYRIENYTIFAGEEASYRNYGVVDSVNAKGFVIPTDTLHRPAGSQGFPGFSPRNEVSEFRENIALYVDNELNFTKSFMTAVALRYERYSDFGSTLNGKFATRLQIRDGLAIRGSVSSGFRAPSLAQTYYNTTYSDVAQGKVLINLIAQNNSPLTKRLGIPALKQEQSVNASGGVTFNSGDLSLTLDGYYVSVKDRIVLTGSFFDNDDTIGEELQKLGISAARFFTNAVNTKTKGVDAVVTYAIPLGSNSLKLSYAGNFNSMSVDEVKVAPRLAGKEDTYFGMREKYFLLASAPKSKMSLSATDKWSLLVRGIRYGKVTLRDYNDEAFEVSTPKVTVDMSVGYQISRFITLSVGGTNIFNAYPDQQDATLTETGGVWEAVQMGFSGAFYFTKLAVKL